MELAAKIIGFKMEGDEAVGMVTENGFVIQVQDADGNVLPLNKENVERCLERSKE